MDDLISRQAAIEKPSVRIDIRIGSPVRIYSADRVGNGEWREGVVRDLYDCFFIVDYGKTRECFLYSDLTCPDTSWRFNKNSHAELRNYFMQELNKSGKTVKQLEQEIPNYSAHHWFGFSSDYRIPTRNNYLRLQEITGCFDRNYDDVRAEFMQELR